MVSLSWLVEPLKPCEQNIPRIINAEPINGGAGILDQNISKQTLKANANMSQGNDFGHIGH